MIQNKQDKKTHTKIDYRVISFIIFTVGFFAVFAIRPSISLIYTLQKEKTEYERIDRVLESKIQQIIMAQAQFMELINNQDLIEQALPSSHQIEKTQALLEQGSKINAFGIQKIIVLPKTQEGINTVTINLSGTSDYSGLISLLDYVNNSRRLITVDFLAVNRDIYATQSADVLFNSILSTYYFSEI